MTDHEQSEIYMAGINDERIQTVRLLKDRIDEVNCTGTKAVLLELALAIGLGKHWAEDESRTGAN
jgi:hypothetical protein